MNPRGEFRVAIIGAGASGLSAIKCCLDEGLTPVCLERTSELGGLWRYTDTVVDGQGSVMKSTVINTSKEMMSFSTYLIPEDYPIFMHNKQVYAYFKQYAEHFHLEQHIRYRTEVLFVRRVPNFVKTGQWEVTTRDIQTGKENLEVFDAVMVCTGHHANKFEPTFPGLSQFQGKVLHTHDYRNSSGFENKTVLVIGIGNSGGDVATELSRCASQVYLSTRQGTWILHRVADSGLPLDMLFSRRILLWLKDIAVLGDFFANIVIRRQVESRINHDLYCLRPNYKPLQQHPMVNDDMPNRIICGAIKVKGDIKTFTSTGVEFKDGSSVSDVDVVVLATGYSFGFPFIDKEVINVQDNEVKMYQNMFVPDLERQTLAIIGCVQGFGAITPAAELQGRLATKVFKREAFLPPREAMWKDIETKERDRKRVYNKSRRHTIQVEVLPFMDSLACLCDCSIDFWHLFRTDPVLALTVVFGPMTPYQYRLYGPGKWSGARQAIMSQWERVYKPLRTRALPDGNTYQANYMYNAIFMLGLLVIAFFFLLRWLFF